MDETAKAHDPDAAPRFVWAMGLTNSAYGFGYASVLVTMPQVLAAHHVPEPAIAGMTAVAGLASLSTFAIAPILDTLVSRRVWAMALGLAAQVLTGLLLSVSPTGPLAAPLMMIDALCLVMFMTSLGGWLGAALPKASDDTVGAWFAIGNGVGFGIGAAVQFQLLEALPAPFGALAITAIGMVPLALQRLIPSPEAGLKAVRESFGDLARDLTVLVRQPLVLRIVVMFVMPCAAFTLTNAFGGLGPDFRVSATTVDLANGAGATVIGMGASLFARWLLLRLPAPVLYLGIGTLGAAFTTLLSVLPRTPLVYILAIFGENIAQSIAQVSQNAIEFGSIRRGSPLAASQFGLMTTAALVPYTYMQWLDGVGYGLVGGVAGSFWMDAGISLLACAILAWPVWHWMRRGQLTAPDLDAPAAG